MEMKWEGQGTPWLARTCTNDACHFDEIHKPLEGSFSPSVLATLQGVSMYFMTIRGTRDLHREGTIPVAGGPGRSPGLTTPAPIFGTQNAMHRSLQPARSPFFLAVALGHKNQHGILFCLKKPFKTNRLNFVYGFCVYFAFKRWVERKAKTSVCAQGQGPVKLREEEPPLTSENPFLYLLVLTPRQTIFDVL